MSPHHLIRPISPGDDAAVAAVIRSVLPEFAASAAGSSLTDAEVAAMSQAYGAPRSAYFVVENAGEVVGGAGIGPLAGAQFEVCELRKMYFLRAARGQGVGAVLLRHSPVREDGPGWRFEVDLPYCVTATQVIERREQFASGLRRPLGATGHCSCDRWFALEL